MSPRSPSDADLVEFALGQTPPERREAIRRGLDAEARERLEEIRAHLSRYDRLECPPPPPPPVPAPRERRGLPLPALAAAAACLVVLALVLARRQGSLPASVPRATLGPGLAVDGRTADDGARPGDRIRAAWPARLALGDSVTVILDEGSRLEYVDPHRLRLERGRAYVTVKAPYPLRVQTSRGDVEVLGTVFEVDLAADRLSVAVERGRVRVRGQTVEAGERWAEGTRERGGSRPGAWFRRPRLRIEAPDRAPLAGGLVLRLVLEAPGSVPAEVAPPAEVATALWLEVRDPTGAVHDVAPVLGSAPFALEAGTPRLLLPGEPLVQEVRIPAPSGLVGVYGCRAMYRPEHEAPSFSPGVQVELVE